MNVLQTREVICL